MPSMKNVKIHNAAEMGNVRISDYYAPKTVGAAKIIAPKQRYAFRFPPMLTWGANDYEKEGVRDGKYKLSLQYPNETTDESEVILQNHKQFQENLIDDVVKNSKKWLGKEMAREYVVFAFKSIFSYPKTNGEIDETRAPSYRVKVPKKQDKWDFEMYNENEELIDSSENENFMDLIVKGTHVPVIWLYNGFVIVNGLVYVSCVLVQIAVSEPAPSLVGKCLLNQNKPTQSYSNENSVSAMIVYDSDDDVKTHVRTIVKEPVIEPVHVQEPVKEPVQEPVQEQKYLQESDEQSVIEVSKKKRITKKISSNTSVN